MLAARNARAVADAADRRVIVAGSVGPTGELMAPYGLLTEDEATEVFAEQIDGLREGGADLVWIETMSALEEMRAAATAAARCGMAFTVTASFDTAGCTMMGVSPAAMMQTVSAFAPAPHGIGCNCGVGASDLLCSALAMTEAAPYLRRYLAELKKETSKMPRFYENLTIKELGDIRSAAINDIESANVIYRVGQGFVHINARKNAYINIEQKLDDEQKDG